MAVPCSNPVPAGSYQTAAAAGGGCTAAVTDTCGQSRDDNDGKSTTVAVNVKVFMKQQMELAIKSSLAQPNCMNDKSVLAATKSEMAVSATRVLVSAVNPLHL